MLTANPTNLLDLAYNSQTDLIDTVNALEVSDEELTTINDNTLCTTVGFSND